MTTVNTIEIMIELAIGTRQVALPHSNRRSPGKRPKLIPNRPATKITPPIMTITIPKMISNRPRFVISMD